MSDDEAQVEKTAFRRWTPILVIIGGLLLVSLFFMPWFVRGMNQRSAQNAVTAAGGRVSYGRRLHPDATYYTNDKKGGEKGFIENLFGEAFVEQLTYVEIKRDLTDKTALGKLSKLRELEVLDLDGANLSDADLKRVAACSKLKKLWINGSQVTAEGLQQLAGISGLASLGLEEMDIGNEAMDAVSSHTNLKRLYLDKTWVTDDGVEKLTGLTQLMGLGLQGTKVTDEVVTHLTKLKELEEVRLGDTVVTDASVPRLAALPRLKSLNLENTNLTESGLAWLANCKTLEIVDLSGTNVSDAITETLGKMPKLITVYLHRTSVSREAWNALCQKLGSGVQVQHNDYSEKAIVK